MFLLVLLIGCKSRGFKNDSFSEIFVSFADKEKIFLSEMISNFELVALETTESSILAEIEKTIVYENQIYVLSNNEIFVFDLEGSFIRKISRIGKGPGEYFGISDFDILYNQIFILDRSYQNIQLYDLYGDFIRTIPIYMWGLKIMAINDSDILIYSGEADNSFNQSKLSLFHGNDKVEGLLPVDQRKTHFLHIRSEQNFVRKDTLIYFHEAFCDKILVFYDNQIKEKYQILYDNNNIPNSFFDRQYENIMDFFNSYNKTNYVNGIYDLFFINDKVFFTVFKNGDKYFVAFNFETGSAYLYDQFVDDLLFKNLNLSIRDIKINYSNGYFLYYMLTHNILKNKDLIKNNELIEIIKNLEEESNPVVLIAM